MRATAAAMNERRRPDPGESYWNDYYARLEARMEREGPAVDTARITARRRSYVSWGYRVAAAVAVLAAGVWIGHSTSRGPANRPATEVAGSGAQPGANGVSDTTRVASNAKREHHDAVGGPKTAGGKPSNPDTVRLASTDVRAKDYIERSQVLLLELINASPDTTRVGEGEYREQQARARTLVSEASVLRDDLPGSDNRRLRELVTELQLVLREIANLESKDDVQAVEIIRNRVNREGVLLKIDVEQMREDNNPHRASPKRSGAID
jgi:hypothetical protein